MIYARRREATKRVPSFIEFYVNYQNGQLSLPRETLERFGSRILQAPQPLGAYVLIPVESKASGPTKKTNANIINDGAWITHSDTIARGAYAHGAVLTPGRAIYFGVPIDPELEFSIDIKKIYDALIWPDCFIQNEPYVMYHGTSRTSVPQIIKDGLRPSYGMLGTAIYLGSFWKAFRFATLTQEYLKRPGAIMRIYVFPKKLPLIKTSMSDVCKCVDCSNSKKGQMCDHLGLWQSVTDLVMLWPGGPIKNEEAAVVDNNILLIDSIANATSTTEHHEPLNRSLIID